MTDRNRTKCCVFSARKGRLAKWKDAEVRGEIDEQKLQGVMRVGKLIKYQLELGKARKADVARSVPCWVQFE